MQQYLGLVDEILGVGRRPYGCATNLGDEVELAEPCTRAAGVSGPTLSTRAPFCSGKYTLELGSSLLRRAAAGVSESMEMPRYACEILLPVTWCACVA